MAHKGPEKIGERVGRVINKYKVAKHFDWVIENGALSFSENADRITAEAALDGLYVIRTSVAEKKLTTAEAVLGYKQLSDVAAILNVTPSPELAGASA